MNSRTTVGEHGMPRIKPSGSPSVLIGVVNYNRWRDTVECVRSLLGCTYSNKAVVVFDNDSEDDSTKQIRDLLPQITLVESSQNLGASGARNEVIRWARVRQPDYLLMIDNDTVVEKDFLQPLVDAIENDPEAAVACGTILEYERPDRIWFAGGRLIPMRGMAVHDRVGEKFSRENIGRPRRVSYITVCMTLYRYVLLERIGPLDERYFVYLEDIEFAARLEKLDLKQLYVPRSVIYHKVQGDRVSAFRMYYCVRNRMLLTREGFGGFTGMVATLCFLMAIATKLVIWRIIKREFFYAARAGLVDYFKGRFGAGRGILMFTDPRTQSTKSRHIDQNAVESESDGA